MNSFQDRIETTRLHVRLVELATNAAVLLAGILAYLLLVAVVDHWVVGLNLWARLVALVVLIVGCAVFFVLKVVPCLVRAVNPVYAARAIEQASPDLKNGLINFLLLRDHDSGVKQAIYDGVRRQAASGLSQVNTDTAVDRSALIRVGYILLALVVAMAAYKVLSPKDPFQSVARVAAPWQTIARPSRTTIEQVEPGNVEVYQGTPLSVTAVVRGLRDQERVELVYSTADGQMVDQTVGMNAADGSSQFACEVSTGSTGVQQDLTYHLRAGDARTEAFRVTVKDAPSIHVQSVTYQYPRYTGLTDQTVVEQGDLSALEGTRVKIEALANQPIRSAYIELFDPTSDDPDEPVKSIPMIHEDEVARGQITLALGTDRKTPMFSAFQLRFSNVEGQRNQQPARYQIEVTPDLPPLVEILTPRRREIELPANRSLFVEVRALDPDFALRRVRLHGVSGGLELLKHPMLEKEHQGQAVLNHRIVPAQLGLGAGDLLVYWAEAEDNRRAAGSNVVEPNLRRTENYRVRIVASDEEEPEADETNQDPSETSNDQSAGGGEGDPSEENQSQGGGSDSSESAENGESADPDAASDAQGQEPDEAESGQEDPNNTQNDVANPSESDNSEPSETESGSEGSNQTPASSDSQSDSQGEEEAVASDGSNDGEAFERILDEMRKDQANDEPSESDPSQTERQEADPNGDPQNADPNGADRQPAESDPTGQPREETDPDSSPQDADDPNGQQRGNDPSPAEQQENDQVGTEEPGSEPSERNQSDADRGSRDRQDKPAEDETGSPDRDTGTDRDTDTDQQNTDQGTASERKGSDPSEAEPQDTDRQNPNNQDASEPRRSESRRSESRRSEPRRSEPRRSELKQRSELKTRPTRTQATRTRATRTRATRMSVGKAQSNRIAPIQNPVTVTPINVHRRSDRKAILVPSHPMTIPRRTRLTSEMRRIRRRSRGRGNLVQIKKAQTTPIGSRRIRQRRDLKVTMPNWTRMTRLKIKPVDDRRMALKVPIPSTKTAVEVTTRISSTRVKQPTWHSTI